MESALLGTISFTPLHEVLLVLAGIGAGIFNGVAGGGSLISFPVLLALGLSPLTANITNTVGIWPGYLGSAAGFRDEISDQMGQLRAAQSGRRSGRGGGRRPAPDHLVGRFHRHRALAGPGRVPSSLPPSPCCGAPCAARAAPPGPTPCC